jgi:hypothetical protein
MAAKCGADWNEKEEEQSAFEQISPEDISELARDWFSTVWAKEGRRRNKPLPAADDQTVAQLDAFSDALLVECIVSTDSIGGRRTRGSTTIDDFIHGYMTKAKKAGEALNAAQRELLHEHPSLKSIFDEDPLITLAEALIKHKKGIK